MGYEVRMFFLIWIWRFQLTRFKTVIASKYWDCLWVSYSFFEAFELACRGAEGWEKPRNTLHAYVPLLTHGSTSVHVCGMRMHVITSYELWRCHISWHGHSLWRFIVRIRCSYCPFFYLDNWASSCFIHLFFSDTYDA